MMRGPRKRMYIADGILIFILICTTFFLSNVLYLHKQQEEEIRADCRNKILFHLENASFAEFCLI